MDLYLPTVEPGFSLQDMIDCDMKMGFDYDTLDICSAIQNPLDLSGLSAYEVELDLKTFEPLFEPIDKIESDESADEGMGEMSTVNSWMNLSSMNNYHFDPESSIMVNPSAILPTMLPSQKYQRETKPKSVSDVNVKTQTPVSMPVQVMPGQIISASTLAKLSSEKNFGSSLVLPLVSHKSSPRLMVPTSGVLSQFTQSVSGSGNVLGGGVMCVRMPQTANVVRSKTTGKVRRNSQQEEGGKVSPFPKPGYSYSCLITLALKNSLTGSLPVSEIYMFMCEHFPYFRSAPTGWKNSVRHNLSLNKCFEKIEKPIAPGSNQRKGCLWALNPAKAHKMDEELQKWSRKDLKGIRDSMTYPDCLDALESGEMKFEPSGSLSSCSEDEEEEMEVEGAMALETPTTVPPIRILKPLTSPVIVNTSQQQRNARVNPSQVQPPRLLIPNLQRSLSSGSNKGGGPKEWGGDEESQFILSDSPLNEMELQNRFGRDTEKKIFPQDDYRSQSSLVRKVPGAASLRTGNGRSSFIYSPSLSSPHHQGVKRLILATNGKML